MAKVKAALASCLAILIGLGGAPLSYGAQSSDGLDGTTCELLSIPAFSTLDTPTFYSDRAGSEIDPERLARNRDMRLPLAKFLKGYAKAADVFVETGDEFQRQCALKALEAWARGDALLRGRVTGQGEAVRLWALGSLSLSTLKMKPTADLMPQDTLAWLRSIESEVDGYLVERKQADKLSNIYYWGLAALIGVNLLEGDADAIDRLADEYRAVLKDIGDDGTLAREMARGKKASRYHTFAAQALVVAGALLKSQGKMDRDMSERLGKLVELCERIIEDPQFLAERAGVRQDRVKDLPWLNLYTYAVGADDDGNQKCDNDDRAGGNSCLLVDTLKAIETSR